MVSSGEISGGDLLQGGGLCLPPRGEAPGGGRPAHLYQEGGDTCFQHDPQLPAHGLAALAAVSAHEQGEGGLGLAVHQFGCPLPV